MKKQLLAAAVACGITLGSAVAPAVADVPITINAGFGHWYFDGDRDVFLPDDRYELDDTDTWFGSLEWAFSDAIAAEIWYSEGDSDYNRRHGYGSFDTDVASWSLNMLFYGGSYIGKPNRIRPYLLLGGGEIDIDADEFDTVETTVNAGLGLRWMLTRRLGLRAEYRLLYSLDEDNKDGYLSAGLNWYFGEVEPPPPPAPLDSDGDGVNDDLDRCPDTPVGTRVDASGCPLPVAKMASIKLLVNFDFDSDVVKEQYFSDLNELADFLKRFEDLQVDVEGHTDSTGSEEYNQQLSQRRSQAVVDVLVEQYGIAASRLQAVGYGESRPVATNDTKEGRAENRRVMATLEVEYEE
jgi:OOP family OmpA-OmpF porin